MVPSCDEIYWMKVCGAWSHNQNHEQQCLQNPRQEKTLLTLKVLVTTIDALETFKPDNYSTVGGHGDVGSARDEPALLPPCPTIRVLSYSTCQRSTHYISK